MRRRVRANAWRHLGFYMMGRSILKIPKRTSSDNSSSDVRFGLLSWLMLIGRLVRVLLVSFRVCALTLWFWVSVLSEPLRVQSDAYSINLNHLSMLV